MIRRDSNRVSNLVVSAMAVVIGMLSGVAAVLFFIVLKWLEVHLIGTGIQFMEESNRIFIVLVPAAGGLAVGLISKFLIYDDRGFGVPQVMKAVTYENGKMDSKVIFIKTISSLITMGSGGSAGRLGPVVQLTAGISSAVGQAFKFTKADLITLVACGVAGGIAAEYNAPMAGVLFAIEVVLGRFRTIFFIPAVISAATSVIVRRCILGAEPIYLFSQSGFVVDNWNLVHFSLLGILSGAFVILYIKVLYGTSDFFTKKISIPKWAKPALGGLIVGIVGAFIPQILGTGGIYTRLAVYGNFTFGFFLLLLVAKLIATSVTLGSGGVGGIFAPSLFMGAMLGGALGSVIKLVNPAIPVPVAVFVIVGMGAVFAATAQAPLTAIVMFIEFTGNLSLALPLMFACVVSSLFSQVLYGYSMFTEKLKRQGIDIESVRQISLGETLTVEDIMQKEVTTVPVDITIEQLVDKMRRTSYLGFPVVDSEGRLVGIVTFSDIRNALIEGNLEHSIESYITRKLVTVSPDCPVPVALGKLNRHGIGRLLVVSPEKPERLLGIVTRSDIIRSCKRI